MKRFIFQIISISIIHFAIILMIMSTADGNTDPFYVRFTSPKQQNMILGTSRAAQGLQPEVFDEILMRSINNFAFTIAHSPFGKVYFESIKRKHNQRRGGLFVIAVDPWSISSWSSDPNNLSVFRENRLCLNKTKDRKSVV